MQPNLPSRTFKSYQSESRIRTVCTLLILIVVAGITSEAQSYNVFARFAEGKGAMPNSLVQAPNGNFYGTGVVGGNNAAGSIFKITPAGAITLLHIFCPVMPCRDGFEPNGIILASDGNFYGTTGFGGESGVGTIFQLTPSRRVTNLYNFCTGQTLFWISSTGKLQTLYNFCGQPNCADGMFPEADLIQAADGQVYGTTNAGGLADGTCNMGCGIAFRIAPPLGGTFTPLHAFTTGEGAQFQKLIQATDGSFYGTAQSGGVSNLGTLFKMNSVGSVTLLFNFFNAAACRSSTSPAGLMQATNGLLYGTTLGPGNGTVFTFGFPPFIKISPNSGPVGTW